MGEPHILSAAAALPESYADQETLLAAFRAHWGRKHFNLDRLEQLHRAVRVGGRHLALPLEQYAQLDSFAQTLEVLVTETRRRFDLIRLRHFVVRIRQPLGERRVIRKNQ